MLGFSIFSPFSFSSHYSYSAYFLLIVSLLALLTFSCVHFCLPPNKYPLPLLMALFKYSRFLYCSIFSFGVSTVSQRSSSSLNMFSASAIIFITCRNRNHMTNNMTYKGNIRPISSIIYLCRLQ